MDESQLLTVGDVAARLRVNPETVRRWLRTGKLHGFMMGGRRAGYRILAESVERIIDGTSDSELLHEGAGGEDRR